MGGLVADEDVGVVGMRPGGAAVAEPAAQCSVTKVAESLAAAGEGDSPVGHVEVVELQVSDSSSASGVLCGQDDDDSSSEVVGQLLDGPDLLI
jgi:hypothetical protein